MIREIKYCYYQVTNTNVRKHDVIMNECYEPMGAIIEILRKVNSCVYTLRNLQYQIHTVEIYDSETLIVKRTECV